MTISYEVQIDPPDAHKTIVVMPGSPGSRRVRFPAHDLDGLGARVVMTERPGFGATAAEPGRTLADHAAQIIEVADELGVEQFAAVGWSAGGSYALACGALHPSRVAVVGLLSAHVSTFDRPEADDFLGGQFNLIVKGMRDDPAGTLEVVTAFLRPQAEQYAADPTAFKEKWIADVAAASGRKELGDFWLDVVDDVIGQPPEHLATEYGVINGPLGFDYADVRMPVCAFHGTSDTNVPIGAMRDLVRRLPDATLTEWEGEGHFLTSGRVGMALQEISSYL